MASGLSIGRGRGCPFERLRVRGGGGILSPGGRFNERTAWRDECLSNGLRLSIFLFVDVVYDCLQAFTRWRFVDGVDEDGWGVARLAARASFRVIA